jgi:nucleoside 2-deoxyribosyltransferase
MEKALINKQVFLSYAFTDRDLAQTTIQKLQKQGVLRNESLENIDSAQTISFDGDIREGIKERIQKSDIVILVWSKDAARSPWVQYEVGMAQALERPILIARADKSAPDLPAELNENQIIELDVEPA